MFIWNNIFLTFAFDSRDNYADVGGEGMYSVDCVEGIYHKSFNCYFCDLMSAHVFASFCVSSHFCVFSLFKN